MSRAVLATVLQPQDWGGADNIEEMDLGEEGCYRGNGLRGLLSDNERAPRWNFERPEGGGLVAVLFKERR